MWYLNVNRQNLPDKIQVFNDPASDSLCEYEAACSIGRHCPQPLGFSIGFVPGIWLPGLESSWLFTLRQRDE